MSADEIRGRKSRILIVDDQPENLQLLIKILTEQGYTVHPAPRGELALRFIETTLPDLILLDIHMPGMDGYEVCERLKADARTHDIPVLFISVADHMLDKVKAFTLGAVDYIVKPFRAEEVLARIGTHISLRRLQQRLEERVQERTAELSHANARLQDEIAERKQAEEEIRKLNAELEQRVADRTAELVEANTALQNEIAERRRTEEILREQKEYLAALHETILGVMNRLELNDLLEALLTRAGQLLGTSNGYIYLIAPGGEELERKVGVGLFRKRIGERLKAGEGLAGKVWQTGQPLVVDDYATWPGRAPHSQPHAIQSLIGVPLKSGPQVVGMLGMAHRPGRGGRLARQRLNC